MGLWRGDAAASHPQSQKKWLGEEFHMGSYPSEGRAVERGAEYEQSRRADGKSSLQHTCRPGWLGGRGFGCDEQDADGHESSAGAALDSVHGVHGPVLTPEVQDDICRAFPRQRLQEVEQLEADAEFHAEMLRCDHKTLCEIRAVAHMQMCEPELALAAWRQCLNFDTSMLPPYDEAVVAHAVQAALCALAHTPAQLDTAREMAALAATTHAIAFGGGRAFLRARYAAEVARSPIVTMAGNGGSSSVEDAFWALVGDAGCDGALPLSPGEITSAAADAATCNQPLQKLTTHA